MTLEKLLQFIEDDLGTDLNMDVPFVKVSIISEYQVYRRHSSVPMVFVLPNVFRNIHDDNKVLKKSLKKQIKDANKPEDILSKMIEDTVAHLITTTPCRREV